MQMNLSEPRLVNAVIKSKKDAKVVLPSRADMALIGRGSLVKVYYCSEGFWVRIIEEHEGYWVGAMDEAVETLDPRSVIVIRPKNVFKVRNPQFHVVGRSG